MNNPIRGFRIVKPLIMLVMFALALSSLAFMASPAQAAPGAQVEGCTQYYTVQRGDYLVKIARMFDTDWRTLAEINDLDNPSLLYAGTRLCVAVEDDDPVIPETGGDSQTVPLIDILGVEEGERVTIRARNFPRNVRFNVLMGEIGTRGVDGIVVATINSGDGSFTRTFDIPRSLADDNRIAIRLESTTTRHFSYNWFDNDDFGDVRDDDREPVVIPPTGDEDVIVVRQDVDFGETVDFYRGNAGVFLPSSAYNGEIELTRISTEAIEPIRGIEFVQQLLEYRVFAADDDEIELVRGLNYVYFNLNPETRAALDRGDLNIYHYNPDEREWEPCEFQIHIGTVNRPYGRLACVATEFGYYGLALED